MSEASDRLARTRLALIQQAQPRERDPERRSHETRERHAAASAPYGADESKNKKPWRGPAWLSGLRHVVSTWWQHHPAHMGVELATPVLGAYARRKPVQFLGIAALVGAAVVVARPWRLISASGVIVALLKSSQLSGLMASAMAAAEFGRDESPYDD